MSGRGKGKGKGKGKGFSWGRGKGKGKGKGAQEEADGPIEKIKPTFKKLKDLRANGNSYDIIVEVGEVKPESTREERRGGRIITVKCTEATVGDETGKIVLFTRQQEKVEALVQGAHVALLNVKLRRVQDSFSLEVDSWSAIKKLEDCQDLLPENFDTAFKLNAEVDRSKKIAPKPTFITVDALEPEKRGIHMVCKVVDLQVEEKTRGDGTSTKVAEATIGDSKGCVSLVARGPQIDVLVKGTVIVIFNAHIEMFNKGFMKLVADRWTDIKPLDSVNKDLLPQDHVTAETPIDEKTNKSKVEWMLVDA
eukprot:GGOE01021443.1.p1 GENE.GGOE01021443.1~~GGOE01021443.1.p1  ORF type:complete len:308 (-),score=40.69 GGOE01021443.1:313-1236(-)